MSDARKNKKNYFSGQSCEMLKFEKEIAYFYGAKNSESISKYYLEALQKLEIIGVNASCEEVEKHVLPPLIKAYVEIIKETSLQFDFNKAATLEMRLILSQAKKASFEEINFIMIDLYREVFKTDDFSIHKAAMLRTFLYQYKIRVLQSENNFSDNDKKIMLLLSKASEAELHKK